MCVKGTSVICHDCNHKLPLGLKIINYFCFVHLLYCVPLILKVILFTLYLSSIIHLFVLVLVTVLLQKGHQAFKLLKASLCSQWHSWHWSCSWSKFLFVILLQLSMEIAIVLCMCIYTVESLWCWLKHMLYCNRLSSLNHVCMYHPNGTINFNVTMSWNASESVLFLYLPPEVILGQSNRFH